MYALSNGILRNSNGCAAIRRAAPQDKSGLASLPALALVRPHQQIDTKYSTRSWAGTGEPRSILLRSHFEAVFRPCEASFLRMPAAYRQRATTEWNLAHAPDALPMACPGLSVITARQDDRGSMADGDIATPQNFQTTARPAEGATLSRPIRKGHPTLMEQPVELHWRSP